MGVHPIHPILTVKGSLATAIGFHVVEGSLGSTTEPPDRQQVLGPMMSRHHPFGNRLEQGAHETIHNPVGRQNVRMGHVPRIGRVDQRSLRCDHMDRTVGSRIGRNPRIDDASNDIINTGLGCIPPAVHGPPHLGRGPRKINHHLIARHSHCGLDLDQLLADSVPFEKVFKDVSPILDPLDPSPNPALRVVHDLFHVGDDGLGSMFLEKLEETLLPNIVCRILGQKVPLELHFGAHVFLQKG